MDEYCKHLPVFAIGSTLPAHTKAGTQETFESKNDCVATLQPNNAATNSELKGLDYPIERQLYAICDIVMEFEVGMLGTDFETRMVIRKFRNGPENLKAISFRVTKDEAITPETVDRIA